MIASIHDRNELAPLSSSKISLASGRETQVAIKQINIIRQPEPYASKCISEWPEKYRNITRNISYSPVLALNFCLAEYIGRLCNCTYYAMMDSLDYLEDRGLVSCFSDPQKGGCIVESALQMFTRGGDLNIWKYLADNQEGCDIKASCSETSYSSTLSTSPWPSSISWPFVLDRIYNAKWPGNLTTAELFGGATSDLYFGNMEQAKSEEITTLFKVTKEKLMQSVAKLKVYFSTSAIEVQEELPKYTVGSLISNLGGAMSLYLGVTIVALFEIVEVVFHCLSGGKMT